MNAALSIIVLGYISCCIIYEMSACVKLQYIESCKCKAEENSISGYKLTCRNLSNFIDLFDSGSNNHNITYSERQTFVDVEITLSHLPEINATFVKNIEAVRRLNLSYNELSKIASDTFHSLISLESLDLSHNLLSDVPNDLLRYLSKLENLSLAANQIQNINSSFFRDLEMLLGLDISRNNLIEIPEDLFSNTRKLKVLLLAHNNMHALPDEIFHNLTYLKILDLSNNQFDTLQPSLFETLKNLRNLSISYNQMKTLKEDTLFHISKNLSYIALLGNPWNCGESHFWIYHWLMDTPEVFDSANELECYDSGHLDNRTFYKDYEIILMVQSMNECDTCEKCNCSLQQDWMIVEVNCTNANLTSVPQMLPRRARRVILNNNKITSFVIERESIDNWKSVSFLGLSNNLISSLQTFEGLFLLTQLIAINLTGNRLQDIPLHLLDQITCNIKQLHLAGNPWLCNCNTVRFQKWLKENYRRINDIENIRCATDGTYTSNKVIYSMMKSELCPQPPKALDYLDILNVTMGVLILLIISKVTYDYWHQKRTGKLPRFFGFNLP